MHKHQGDEITVAEAHDVLAQFGPIKTLKPIDRKLSETLGIENAVIVEFVYWDRSRDIVAVSGVTVPRCSTSPLCLLS